MEQPISKPKWEAKVSTKLANASADQIWPFLEDFFGIHKYFPSLAASYGIHGSNGEIGSIRYCEGSSIPSQETKDNKERSTVISWSKEKLTAIDPAEKSLSYEIIDSNTGFHSYVSTIQINKNPIPAGDSTIVGSGDEDGGRLGCVIEWSFSVDAVGGWRLEDLVKKYEVGLHRMAQKMEDILNNSGEGRQTIEKLMKRGEPSCLIYQDRQTRNLLRGLHMGAEDFNREIRKVCPLVSGLQYIASSCLDLNKPRFTRN
nr:lachrymatory-factor synthase isoform X2 [Coffea arabica]